MQEVSLHATQDLIPAMLKSCCEQNYLSQQAQESQTLDFWMIA